MTTPTEARAMSEPKCRCCEEPFTQLDGVWYGKDGRLVHYKCYERGHGDHCKHTLKTEV